MTYLGLDWGLKKIGVALAQSETALATPLLTLAVKNWEEVMARLAVLIKEEGVDALVVGQPVDLAGAGKASKEFERFLERLKQLGRPVYLEDERMSTHQAQSAKKSLDLRPGKADDAESAAIILQSYLDRSSLVNGNK